MTDARIREGDPDDFVAAMRILEGALLDADPEAVRKRLREPVGRADTVLVAETDERRVIGALVLVGADGAAGPESMDHDSGGAHVEAIAVHRPRRGSGVGSALVSAARERAGRLTADFDPRVRDFYESLGFEIENRDGRLWGEIDGA